MAMFTCEDDVTTFDYTLVCDFRHDCRDQSDESFCKHPPCDGFLCDNGQCVRLDKRCNRVPDCMDNSEEYGCILNLRRFPALFGSTLSMPPPALINLDGSGYYT